MLSMNLGKDVAASNHILISFFLSVTGSLICLNFPLNGCEPLPKVCVNFIVFMYSIGYQIHIWP